MGSYAFDQAGMNSGLDNLLRSLACLKRTFDERSTESMDDWNEISESFGSLMGKSDAKASTIEKEPSIYLPPPRRRCSPTKPEIKVSLMDLLEQREKLHVKQRAIDGRTINNLIDGQKKIAESFKSIIEVLCSERDSKVATLEARIEILEEELEDQTRAYKRYTTKPQVNVLREEHNERIFFLDEWPDLFEFTHLTDGEWSESEDDVDRHSDSIGRHRNDSKDEASFTEKLKLIQIRDPHALPPTVQHTVPVDEESREEGKPRLTKLIRKNNEPEAVFLNCMVEDVNKPLRCCLVDTGATINIMSWNTAKFLGVRIEEKKDIGTIALVGGSHAGIEGIARSIHLKIGTALVEVDFHIVGMNNDGMGEAILGTCFLRQVGAVIDFDVGRISFNKIDPTKFYTWSTKPVFPPGFKYN